MRDVSANGLSSSPAAITCHGASGAYSLGFCSLFSSGHVPCGSVWSCADDNIGMGSAKRGLGTSAASAGAPTLCEGSGNQLGASRASPCGAGVRSLSQCYFNHVPDKLFWTFWPMFARFWKLFSLFSPCLHPDAKRWLSQGQLYLGFFGIFNEEFSENWLERLALTASPAGYSPLQLTFSLFIQFPSPPSRISHQPALIPSIFSLAAAVVPRFKMERS